jgi:hypothetical protein
MGLSKLACSMRGRTIRASSHPEECCCVNTGPQAIRSDNLHLPSRLPQAETNIYISTSSGVCLGKTYAEPHPRVLFVGDVAYVAWVGSVYRQPGTRQKRAVFIIKAMSGEQLWDLCLLVLFQAHHQRLDNISKFIIKLN